MLFWKCQIIFAFKFIFFNLQFNIFFIRLLVMETLHKKTLFLLKNRSVKMTFAKIEKETGINQAWLRAFSTNQMKNPGVNTIQALYEFLSGKSLNDL